ncbi:MAG: HNH endonuclease [Chloroflexi bacterium]|nr:HNH endonuclease [Chloroflexota bacterium]
MSEASWAETIRRVHERAGFLCEYCQTAQYITGQAMHVDHIDPEGDDALDNLCLACGNCNLSKAKATSAADPETQRTVPLFNPRTQVWSEHFEWTLGGTVLHGLTSVGRATVERLRINQDRVVSARSLWVFAGVHPPR